MKQYTEVVLPIVEETNGKAFQIAGGLSIVGIAILGCSVGLLDVGALRSTGVVLGLVLMVLPFALRFVMDQHKKIGLIRFSEFEILTKLNGENEIIHDVNSFNVFEFDIVDFEGETKARDLARTSSTLNVRTGSDNQVYWKTEEKEYHFQFKLNSELHKRQAVYLLRIIREKVRQ